MTSRRTQMLSQFSMSQDPNAPKFPGGLPSKSDPNSKVTDGKTDQSKVHPDSLFSEFDLHLFGEGANFQIYNLLGAHRRNLQKQEGTNFAVWAPNAKNVSLIGDFNEWKHGANSLRRLDTSGIWETFIPDIKSGTTYKFAVENQDGSIVEKSDPFGFWAEVPPKNASIVFDLDFEWSDSAWINRRENSDFQAEPISIYEVHLGSWLKREGNLNGWLSYRELAHRLVDYAKEMGFTHLELLPISEHPYTGSWGYQTVGYYSATSRYGNPHDLMYFINHCHENGIGVIIDWVPAHFPKDSHGLARFDGTALYEHMDPRQGVHPDWNTLIFNYGRNEVRNYLVANALFWLDKYHVDGLRVDAVASMLYLDYSRKEGRWIPNRYGGRENLEAIEFLKQFNEQIHSRFPGALTIAEESTSWGGVSRPTHSGGLGFSIKWNMGWMNDTLSYMRHEPVHRKFHHDKLTFSLLYAFSENFMMPFSHDEVVHGKRSLLDQMPGDLWKKFANLRLLFSYQWTHPGKKLLFMGNEIGQWHEWNCDDQLQWELLDNESHTGLKKLVADLNKLYANEPALYELDFESDGFEWIDCHNPDQSVLSFLRKSKDENDFLVIVCNFTPVVRHDYRIGLPRAGSYKEIFNSDSEYYGGSNVGNPFKFQTEEIEHHERPYSATIQVPPLGTVMFRPVKEEEAE